MRLAWPVGCAGGEAGARSGWFSAGEASAGRRTRRGGGGRTGAAASWRPPRDGNGGAGGGRGGGARGARWVLRRAGARADVARGCAAVGCAGAEGPRSASGPEAAAGAGPPQTLPHARGPAASGLKLLVPGPGVTRDGFLVVTGFCFFGPGLGLWVCHGFELKTQPSKPPRDFRDELRFGRGLTSAPARAQKPVVPRRKARDDKGRQNGRGCVCLGVFWWGLCVCVVGRVRRVHTAKASQSLRCASRGFFHCCFKEVVIVWLFRRGSPAVGSRGILSLPSATPGVASRPC